MPHLTFFCELDPGALTALFERPDLVDDLRAMNAGISLGLIDLSPERADVVQRLNRAGIPVTAWLLLPREAGYWFNLDNAAAARARYENFRRWTADHGLSWARVGLDIETDIREVERQESAPWAALLSQLGRAIQGERLRQGLAQYRDLLAQIQADGYFVESYQTPPIVDERLAGSTLLQRLFGLVDLAVDREVLMLYTSLLGGRTGMLWSYAADSQAIAVGSTGGGVDTLPKLGWDELARDLLLAHCWTDELYIFSLEGCVQRDYLARLRDFDWSQPVSVPFGQAGRIDQIRRLGRAGLWVAGHPAALLAIPALVGAWRLLRPRDHKSGLG